MSGADELRELVTRCLSDDREAVRTFVERFQQLVFSLCLQMLRHRQDAEDVAQEAIVRAVRHLDHWDSSRPIEPWLLAIAGNRCRTALERRSRRPRVMEALPEVVAPADAAPRGGIGEEVQRAVDGLRDDYRQCFTLFHVQQLSVQEIADQMHVPTGTVKTWLHRARKELAEELTRRGVKAG
ncbi:MAG: RNA polymerase sigma factor [Planctomycetota bacterium]|nr:MAG: RNA polymerase sigma factor [Planctomycetota bacterium]